MRVRPKGSNENFLNHLHLMGWRASDYMNINRILYRHPDMNVVAGMRTNQNQLERVSRVYYDYMKSIENAIKQRVRRELGLLKRPLGIKK